MFGYDAELSLKINAHVAGWVTQDACNVLSIQMANHLYQVKNAILMPHHANSTLEINAINLRTQTSDFVDWGYLVDPTTGQLPHISIY